MVLGWSRFGIVNGQISFTLNRVTFIGFGWYKNIISVQYIENKFLDFNGILYTHQYWLDLGLGRKWVEIVNFSTELWPLIGVEDMSLLDMLKTSQCTLIIFFMYMLIFIRYRSGLKMNKLRHWVMVLEWCQNCDLAHHLERKLMDFIKFYKNLDIG